MIDRLLAAANQVRGVEDEAGYRPENAIIGTTYCEPKDNDAEEISVVFPPWHSSPKLNHQIQRRLHADGYGSMLYDLDHRMLNTDMYSVRDSFEFAAVKIAGTINEVVSPRFSRIHLLGFSLGNAVLCMVTEKLTSFNDVTMIVPGTELATPFWTGIRTRQLSNVYRKSGCTLEQLQDAWRDIAPAAHLDILEGHNVDVVLAAKDQYIPFNSGRALVTAMIQKGLNPNIKTSSRGHVATIACYALGGLRNNIDSP